MHNSFIEHLAKKIDIFTEHTGRVMAWLMLFMVILSFSVVVLRYGFNVSTIMIQEGILYLHATVFMLGAAYTLKHDSHVRVDILYQHMSTKKKALVDLLGGIFLLIPFTFFVFFMCLSYVTQSWSIGEQSSEPGGLAFVYIHKSLMLLLPIVLLAQALAETIKHYLLFKSPIISDATTSINSEGSTSANPNNNESHQ